MNVSEMKLQIESNVIRPPFGMFMEETGDASLRSERIDVEIKALIRIECTIELMQCLTAWIIISRNI